MLMSWTSVRSFYGLRKPYEFRIAIPLLLNLVGLIFVFSVCAFLIADHNLDIGTVRFYFFCYLVLLLLIAAILSRVAFLSLAIFLWCATELALAMVSIELERRGTAS